MDMVLFVDGRTKAVPASLMASDALGHLPDGVRFVAGHGEADRVHVKELED